MGKIKPKLAVVVCIGSGLVCLAIAWSLGHDTLPEFTFAHTGVALIVAGMVGIGYEIWSDRQRLQEHIDAIALLNRAIGEERFHADIAGLFPLRALETTDDSQLNEVYDQIRRELTQLVSFLNVIRKQSYETVVLVQFVNRLLGYASEAAETLAHNEPGAPGRPLKLPKTAAHLTAEILSGQMAAMSGDDSYSVISDFRSWQGEALRAFLDETRRTVQSKKVLVRRVFANFIDDNGMDEEEVRLILKQHWELASTFPRYELAVSTSSYYPHLGVFQCNGLPICFRPEIADLSEIVFSRVDLTGTFEACWTAAVKARRAPSGRRVRGEMLPFDEFWAAVAAKNPAFWSRFAPSRIAVVPGAQSERRTT